MSTLPYTVVTTAPGKQVSEPAQHFINASKAIKFTVAQVKLGHQNHRIEKNGVFDGTSMQLVSQQLAKLADKKARPEIRALEHLSELSGVLAKVVKTEDLTMEQREELTQAYLAVARALPALENTGSWTMEDEEETKLPTGPISHTVVANRAN